ncbi:hypothetical protein [Stygiolobus caldivivus]|uniref:hypothetical protein n=1 Tax=Stygiolobus caldivivus TaxID=2824673 RepID=UPI001C85F910|nr:hypothetical protein [Stygiolobus caldivivus]
MNKEFYERLLKAENKYDRLDGWKKADILYNAIDLRSLKRYFLELLKDEDIDVALHAWQMLPQLIKLGVIDKGDYDEKELARALREGDINAWWIAYDLWKEGVVTIDLLKSNIQYFEKALRGDPYTRISSWSLLPYFLEIGLVEKPSDDYLNELLDQPLNIHIKLNVVYLILELKEKGVINKINVKGIKEVMQDPNFKTLSEAYEKDWRKAAQYVESIN